MNLDTTGPVRPENGQNELQRRGREIPEEERVVVSLHGKPRLVRSEIYPGTAQQFRAQMQRIYNQCVIPIWPPAIEALYEVPQKSGRWESSTGDRLTFREERQLAPSQPGDHPADDDSFIDEPGARADTTPQTRTTWAVVMLPRKERYTEIPDPRPPNMETLVYGSLDGSEKRIEYEVTLKEYGYAGIEAYEQHSGTRVDFLDGYDAVGVMDWGLPPVYIPIGPAFDEFCEMVVEDVWSGECNRPQ